MRNKLILLFVILFVLCTPIFAQTPAGNTGGILSTPAAAIIGMAIVSVRSRVVHLFIGILGQRLYSETPETSERCGLAPLEGMLQYR